MLPQGDTKQEGLVVPRKRICLTAAVLTMTAAVSLRAGGWSVITVDDLPEFVRAGEPFTLTYAVRQHGVSLISNLAGRVEAQSGDQVVVAPAVGAKPGYYKATLTLPRAGSWTLNVSSGFAESMTGRPTGVDIHRDGPPMKLLAVSAAAPPPAVQTSAERGLQLYVSKGCVSCHAHARSGVRSLDVGPDLTSVAGEPDYLRTVLLRGVRRRDLDMLMPDLGLRTFEIDALVHFLKKDSGNYRVSSSYSEP